MYACDAACLSQPPLLAALLLLVLTPGLGRSILPFWTADPSGPVGPGMPAPNATERLSWGKRVTWNGGTPDTLSQVGNAHLLRSAVDPTLPSPLLCYGHLTVHSQHALAVRHPVCWPLLLLLLLLLLLRLLLLLLTALAATVAAALAIAAASC